MERQDIFERMQYPDVFVWIQLTIYSVSKFVELKLKNRYPWQQLRFKTPLQQLHTERDVQILPLRQPILIWENFRRHFVAPGKYESVPCLHEMHVAPLKFLLQFW